MSYGFKLRAVTSCSNGGSAADLPKSYAEAQALFERADKRRGQARGKIAHNTYLEEASNGSYAVRLHLTRIVTFYPDGSIVLDTGGWQTMTTRDRINRCGIRLTMSGGVPSVSWRGHVRAYVDGMRLGPLGGVLYPNVRLPIEPVEDIRRRRRRALARSRRGSGTSVVWRWPVRQGGWTPYAGTVPEAFE